MSNWTSTDDLAQSLGLEVDSGDHEAIRAELLRRIKAVHPDGNDGSSFRSAEEKEEFDKYTQALQYLDKRPSTAVIPVDDLRALVEACARVVSSRSSDQAAADRNDYRQTVRLDRKSQYFMPKLTSVTCAAACGGALALSSQLVENPFLGQLFGQGHISLQLSLMLLLGFLYGGVATLWLWVKEHRDIAFAEWLATEEGFREFIQRLVKRQYRELGEVPRVFLFDRGCEIVSQWNDTGDANHIGRRRPVPLWLRFGRPSLGQAAAEKLVKMHFDEMERRGIAKEVKKPSIDKSYELSREVVAEAIVAN